MTKMRSLALIQCHEVISTSYQELSHQGTEASLLQTFSGPEASPNHTLYLVTVSL